MNFKKYHVSRNLWNGTLVSGTISSQGVEGDSQGRIRASIFTELESGTYTLNASALSEIEVFVFVYNTSGTFVERIPITWTSLPYTFSLESRSKIKFVFAYAPATSMIAIQPSDISNIMLNTGSTPLPYEPYSSEVWHDTPHYIHNTSTDTITTLPAVVYPNDTTATVGLKGNMSQTGTPTPDNPIQPQETGERTGNLFSSEWEQGSINSTDGQNVVAGTVIRTKDYIPIKPNTAYSFSRNITSAYMNIRLYRANKSYIGIGSTSTIRLISGSTVANPMSSGLSFCCFEVIDSEVAYIRFNDASNDLATKWNMVEGEYTEQTMPNYEPYGIKIPILSNSTKTNVYLGEVQTTRKIKNYAFTGEETFNGTISSTESGTSVYSIRYDAIGMEDIIDYDSPMPYISYPVFICSHFKMKTNTSFDTPYTAIKNGEIGANSVANNTYNRYVIFASNQYTSVDTFKAFLADQYANGTPVTIWYVLATETTGIVNEPLRKIGGYADTVSNVSIPVTAGGDTLSVDTTLQPSEVTVNYKGWHPVADVHEFTGNYTVGTMQTLPISELETHTISDLQGGEWS